MFWRVTKLTVFTVGLISFSFVFLIFMFWGVTEAFPCCHKKVIAKKNTSLLFELKRTICKEFVLTQWENEIRCQYIANRV